MLHNDTNGLRNWGWVVMPNISDILGMWTKNSNITNFKMMNTTRKGLKRPSK